MNEIEMRSVKLKDLIVPVREILNVPVPLVETPPLDRIRSALMVEFPYAIQVIDFALADLMGRSVVKMRPLLLVGDPGGGKSRFARRLGELLNLTVWRIDAAQSDGSAFAGTDRRWHSAECCHPLLAIARGRTANPLILIDELEKAATRTDYGRLWDCLLGFIEPETGSRYPDPALQIRLDLSHVNYIATANSLQPLPMPLRDRFRIMYFPKPTIDDLDALLPGLLQAIAAERGVDARWITPIDVVERAIITKHWPGGSIRRLLRILEAVLQARDHRATRQ
jgi:ATP-dependent Lon protease